MTSLFYWFKKPLAITNVLRSEGHKVGLVHSKPRLDFDREESHVFPIVHVKGETPMVIDTTFGSFLRFAGLTPEGVMIGEQMNNYPDEKILTFDRGDTRRPVALLTRHVNKVLGLWLPGTNFLQKKPVFESLTTDDIRQNLAEFWNPYNFALYEPTKEVVEAASIVSKRIKTANLQIAND